MQGKKAVFSGIAMFIMLVVCLSPLVVHGGGFEDSWFDNFWHHEWDNPYFRDEHPPPGNDDFYIPQQPWQPSSSAWRSDTLGFRPLPSRQFGLDIRGSVPIIDNSFFSADSINHVLDSVIASLLNDANRLRARAIDFRFKHYSVNDVVSIVIYAEVLTTIPHTLVRSVNFRESTGQLICMNNAMGMDVIPLAERILAEKIRNNPEHFYAALSAPIAGQAFYLTHDRLVILFDGFRLSSRIEGVGSIELFHHNIRGGVLQRHEYREGGPYGLKMIPVRRLLHELLGFHVIWHPDASTDIIRNGRTIVSLRAYDNNYIINGTHHRFLEAAPELIIDHAGFSHKYVPITFFDHILPLTTYSINSWDGSITFLTYLAH